MNAVLWGNGIGNFVMATPLFQNLNNPTIYIPKDDNRRESIADISPFEVKIFEYEKDWGKFNKIYQMWTAPKLDRKNVIAQRRPKLHDWRYGHESEWNLRLIEGGMKFAPLVKYKGGFDIQTASHEKLIGVVNGGNGWDNKKLKHEKVIELCKTLRDNDYMVVFFGGKDETKLGKQLERECHILNFAGMLSLSSTINTMTQCDTIISNDTGLMHCAGAINKDIICLWGCTWWEKNRPLCKGKVTKIQGYCKHSPCYGGQLMKDCKDNICMDIDISEIMEAL